MLKNSKADKKKTTGISLVLLCFNEIEGTRHLIDKIPMKTVSECFAVDGGSTDGTREFLKKKRVMVVDQKSKGRGEAFRIAFKKAKYNNLVFFSLDGNEDPRDIAKFAEYFEKEYDMVIASRMCAGAKNEEDDNLLKIRKWANNFFNFTINIIWNRSGKYVTDSINGFRGITKEAWKKMNLDGEGYTIEYQSTIRALKLGLKIAEFPTHEGARIGGESQAKSIPTGIKFIKLLLKEIRIGKKF